jgi:hypothetical protein
VRTASSNDKGGERGGSGSENHGVGPSGQSDSPSVHCNVSFEIVDTGVQPESDDEMTLAKT